MEKEIIDALKQIFDDADTDKDGLITASEFKILLSDGSLNSMPENQIFLTFKLLDTNGDEKLDKDEFLSFTTGSLFDVKNNDELKRFFRAFDSQNTGFISEIELKLVMEVFGVPVTDEDIKEAIKMADTNGDGKINYDEFAEMLKSA